MSPLRPYTASLFLCLMASVSHPAYLFSAASLGPQHAPPNRDGRHDFDFNVGTWITHISRLQNPLTGSTAWTKLLGTVAVRKVWEGRGELEEIEAEGPNGHWEGLTLFLYNAQAHQWSQTFADSQSGTLGVPLIGEFKNGRGELFSQELFDGRTILTRGVWSEITPDSHKFEQAFSNDGGKTWETNFVATLTRAK